MTTKIKVTVIVITFSFFLIINRQYTSNLLLLIGAFA